jgi:hypothetical protein
MSSPLAHSSKPASLVPGTGRGAPSLPRQAADVLYHLRRWRVQWSPVKGGRHHPFLPIPEADARMASEVAPAETKSGCQRGREADVFKEAAITQVEFAPTPVMEAASGPAKDATVGDEGVVNGTSVTIIEHRV